MNESKTIFDVVVLGAGGAGMMCAATAARLGKSTIVLDHADVLGRKILISGGGRCNFTNLGANPTTYHSGNEHFAKSALARYKPQDFLALVEKHKVPYYEKKLGQQFCRDSAQRIVDLLKAECEEAGATIQLGTQIQKVEKVAQSDARFSVSTSRGEFLARSLVVATGGLSIPKIGATDLGYQIAKQFGLKVTDLDPALVSLTMPPSFMDRFGGLSGVSVEAEVRVGTKKFVENVLFTHSGLSGPAILQASLYWHPPMPIYLRLLPALNWEKELLGRKAAGSGQKKALKNVLAELLTERLAEVFLGDAPADTPINQISDQVLRKLADALSRWEIFPAGNGGYNKAEVTRGGVATEGLSSKTLEAKDVPGLFFIGEVVDVTGMLGGYNFQWAWASGFVAGESA